MQGHESGAGLSQIGTFAGLLKGQIKRSQPSAAPTVAECDRYPSTHINPVGAAEGCDLLIFESIGQRQKTASTPRQSPPAHPLARREEPKKHRYKKPPLKAVFILADETPTPKGVRRVSAQFLAHVNPAQAVLFDPMGFDKPSAGVQGNVFAHGFVGVEPD